MYDYEFAALAGGKNFTTWLQELRSSQNRVAFQNERSLQVLPQAISASRWLAKEATSIVQEADSYLEMPVHLPSLVDGHGHQFFCVDGTLLVPMPENVGGKCPRCGKEYVGEQYENGAAYLRQFDFIRMTLALASAYRINNQPVYAQKALAILSSFADLYHRRGQLVRQTLDEAWRVATLAYAYGLVADSVASDAPERAHIEQRLLRASADRIWRGYDQLGNWGACHDVGIGVIGLTLRDEQLIKIALHGFLRRAHSYFHPDGLGVEGSIGTYHNMTTHNMMTLAEAFLPTGIDLYAARFRRGKQERILETILDAQLNMAYPDGRLPALHDGWYFNACLLCPDLYEMAYRRYGKPAYWEAAATIYHVKRFCGEVAGAPLRRSQLSIWPGIPTILPSYPLVWDYYVRSLFPSADEWVEEPRRLFPPPDFWEAYQGVEAVGEGNGLRQESLQCAVESSLPSWHASVHYPAAGFAVMREVGRDTYLLCDYGPHGGGHGHPDKLQIALYAHGRVLVPDYGTSAYGLPIASKWYKRTLSHNTLMLDGADQAAGQAELCSISLDEQPQRLHAVANHAYPGASLERRLVLHDGLVLICDSMQSRQPHTCDWLLHVRGELVAPDLLPTGENEPVMDYTYLRNPRWYDAQDCSGRLSWRSAEQAGLDAWWVASSPVRLLAAQAPGAPVERYDSMISLRSVGERIHYAVLLEPVAGQARVVGFQVCEAATGMYQYKVELVGGQVLHGLF